ncbi:sensor histidine kinase [Faecalimicrobium sp. JNUCC 81]
MMNKMIREICREHTHLSGCEIEKIIEVSKSLDLMANLYNSDVFIDVLSKDKNEAFVVSHAKPKNKSLYKEIVIGKRALNENEPGVIETLNTGITTRNIKALTQECKVVSQTIQPINLNDKVIAVLIVEEELVLKSVAVREAHHRVKNNLQTIISLLRKQSRISNNEEVKNCLDNITNRVFAILSTHHLLSKEVNNNISILSAMNLLVSNIQGGYCDNKEINICIEGEDFKINGEKATALLLVMNEVIQNCYDHAFEGREHGNIKIAVNKENDYKSIVVIDDGIGFQEKYVNEESLGTYIIDSYIKQVLKGNIERDSNERGTKISIKIPSTN